MPTHDDRGDIAAAKVPDAGQGEWHSKMKPRPYCPVCHSFDYHGVRCEGIGWSVEDGGEPITE